MFKVEFENARGQKREIGKADTYEQALQIVSDFLKSKNYVSYYTRTIEIKPNVTQLDVGSWSEFFYITKL